MKMQEILIETNELRKEYKMGNQIVRALSGVSTKVAPGELLSVMGPSGSGKSTFMNLLGCLDTPTSGTYLLEGKEVSSLSGVDRAKIRNRRIGFVFQSFNLLARTSALENVALPLRYNGISRKKRLQRAEEKLEMMGLKDRMDHHPSQLSGGQQQRVAIARALVCNPAIILADEPTGALDTRTGVEVMSIFQQLNREGMTIVIVTHEHEIAEFTRRRLTFRDGIITSDKTNDWLNDADRHLGEMKKAPMERSEAMEDN
jgi:putative ABC transport system ATP-binding protein